MVYWNYSNDKKVLSTTNARMTIIPIRLLRHIPRVLASTKKQIMIEDWKKLAQNYDDKDWAFSSAKAWKEEVSEKPTEYSKIQYVDQLRLSGDFFRANEVIKTIDINNIPEDYKFVYYIRKGMLHEEQGELSEAIINFRKSIKLQNQETYPYVFLASALSRKSKLDEVEMVLKEALSKEGDIDEVNYNLSLNFARKGNFREAIVKMEECLKIEPKFEDAKTWLADFKNMEKKTLEG